MPHAPRQLAGTGARQDWATALRAQTVTQTGCVTWVRSLRCSRHQITPYTMKRAGLHGLLKIFPALTFCHFLVHHSCGLWHFKVSRYTRQNFYLRIRGEKRSKKQKNSREHPSVFLVAWSFLDSSLESHFAGKSNKLCIQYQLCVKTVMHRKE